MDYESQDYREHKIPAKLKFASLLGLLLENPLVQLLWAWRNPGSSLVVGELWSRGDVFVDSGLERKAKEKD